MIEKCRALWQVLSLKLVLLSSLSACTTILILHTFTMALQLDSSNSASLAQGAVWFSVAFIGFVVVQLTFQRSVIRLTETTIKTVRLDILDAVRHARLQMIEQFGQERILSAIAYDANTLSQLNQFVALSVGHLFTVIAALIYMFVVAPMGALLALGLIALAVTAYCLRFACIHQGYERAREAEDSFFTHLHDLLMGIREVKQNAVRNDSLYQEHLTRDATAVQHNKIMAECRFAHNQLMLMAALYLLAAVAVFVAPLWFALSPQQSISFVIITLFMVSPFHSSMELFRVLSQLQVSQQKLAEIKQLASEAGEQSVVPSNVSFSHRLTLHKLMFEYQQGFTVGPVNLEVNQGDIVFISGGNGSGKTTFMRLLSGLYAPRSGQIWLDNTQLDDAQLLAYRQLFSGISADSVVFADRYGQPMHEALINQWLDKLALSDKVQFRDGRFTNTRLSTGQMKRLALVQALMEERPILVLDEFAANIDPESRQVFYRQWLPTLKAMGKTLFVITHDEAYFDCCDCHYLMRDGQLHPYPAQSLSLVKSH
ncbi:ATP-binding cassette domain-containing protein [Pseudoalteromonas rubra]|uniref:ATP-binding cassette domain-containing protein n=1 Tax=Pseudoalteromonas rubra TaxID=43658 RepID=UPI002DB559DD|nr:ATP-binding cassette domain-containing protein [Pseudoalteromonas rubra]MEC4088021.1 ATP-binding cassette domain-containing protein [Pseudoalteromonas rubra]